MISLVIYYIKLINFIIRDSIIKLLYIIYNFLYFRFSDKEIHNIFAHELYYWECG